MEKLSFVYIKHPSTFRIYSLIFPFFEKVSLGRNMLVRVPYTHSTLPTRRRPIPCCRLVGISQRSNFSFVSSSRAKGSRKNVRSSYMWLSMTPTAADIPSHSMERSARSLGTERAEWGEFRIGSQSITLQTRSR